MVRIELGGTTASPGYRSPGCLKPRHLQSVRSDCLVVLPSDSLLPRSQRRIELRKRKDYHAIDRAREVAEAARCLSADGPGRTAWFVCGPFDILPSSVFHHTHWQVRWASLSGAHYIYSLFIALGSLR